MLTTFCRVFVIASAGKQLPTAQLLILSLNICTNKKSFEMMWNNMEKSCFANCITHHHILNKLSTPNRCPVDNLFHGCSVGLKDLKLQSLDVTVHPLHPSLTTNQSPKCQLVVQHRDRWWSGSQDKHLHCAGSLIKEIWRFSPSQIVSLTMGTTLGRKRKRSDNDERDGRQSLLCGASSSVLSDVRV